MKTKFFFKGVIFSSCTYFELKHFMLEKKMLVLRFTIHIFIFCSSFSLLSHYKHFTAAVDAANCLP